MFEIGIVGCGYWGPNLIRNFGALKGSRVKYLCDLSQARLDAVKDLAPTAKPTTRFEDLLEDRDLPAVAIATPTSSHYPLAIRAIEAGKHVLIEKPIAGSAADAKRLVDAAKAAKRVLMVDHTFIYTAPVRKIKELIDSGDLGDLLYFDSVRVNLGLFQSDVNVVWDLAPHDLSIIDYLFPMKPVAVAAHGQAHFGQPHENIAYLTLFFADDVIAHIHVNWISPVKVRTIMIGGSKKMVVWDDIQVAEPIKIYDRGVDIDKEGGVYNALVQYRIGDVLLPRVPAQEALRVEADHFRNCVLNGETPLTDGEMGLRVLKILEAAQLSLRQAGRIVRLDEIQV